MAIELRFQRADKSSHWGFTLTGGADYDQPLIVVKVAENSLAENSGLRVDDVIVRIDDSPTAGLTHTQAHDLLHAAGNEFVLGIRRGEIMVAQTTPNDEEGNAEVTSILKVSLPEPNDGVPTLSPSQNLAGQEVIVSTSSVEKLSESKRKWSTFLQKPKNLRPKPKLTDEDRNKGAPYRVIIKKQKKKDPNKKHVEFKEELEAVEPVVAEESSTSNTEEQTVEISEIQDTEEVSECNHEEEECTENDVAEEISEMTEESSFVAKTSEGSKRTSIDIDTSESSLTLEEQLAQVQRQLQALSQLPSAIQVTLDAVTKQLTKIVSAKHQEQNTEEIGEGASDKDNTEQLTTEDIIEDSITTDVISEDVNNNEDEQSELIDEDDSLNEDILDVSKTEGEEEAELDVSEVLTEEEKEARRIQEQLEAKKQKEKEEKRRRQAMKPIQRPIILPGGRRWSNPDDACPKVRNPKMSDDKIADTIETYSEVLVGKAKGINFLKYQPPPKNLDYLQKSEVYRLVHDMEPPVRGISTRAEKILSEQDYYENKGAP